MPNAWLVADVSLPCVPILVRMNAKKEEYGRLKAYSGLIYVGIKSSTIYICTDTYVFLWINVLYLRLLFDRF